MNKLPAWRLARHAYLDVIANAQGLLRVGGLWLLLSWTLLMLGRSSALFGAAADLAVAIGAAAIAVTWHRHILHNEPLAARFAPVDARVVRYFVFTVILAFVVGIIPLSLLLMTTGGATEAGAAAEGAPGSGCSWCRSSMVACIYVAMRLQLIFPATAIGDQGADPGPLLGGHRRQWLAAGAGLLPGDPARGAPGAGRGPLPGLGRRGHRQLGARRHGRPRRGRQRLDPGAADRLVPLLRLHVLPPAGYGRAFGMMICERRTHALFYRIYTIIRAPR